MLYLSRRSAASSAVASRPRQAAVSLLVGLLAFFAVAGGSLAAGVGTGSAKADTITYWYDNLASSGVEGPRHTLQGNTAYDGGGNGVCANAKNDTNTSWVGTTQCNSILMNIAYCQCALRYPWAASQTWTHVVRAWEDF